MPHVVPASLVPNLGRDSTIGSVSERIQEQGRAEVNTPCTGCDPRFRQ